MRFRDLWIWLREHFLYLLFALALVMSACGFRAPGETETPVVPIPSPEPVPTPISNDVRMSYGYWGGWAFDQPLMPYPSLAVSNKTDWSKGKITFGLTGFSKSDIPYGPKKDFIPFMAKLKGKDGKEANFHYNIADHMPRFIGQRFDGCKDPGRDFCEEQSMVQSPSRQVEWDASKTYWFTFEWNESQVNMSVGDDTGEVHGGSVQTKGVYTGVEWIRVGNGVLEPYPGLQVDVTVINPVLE